MRRFLDSFLWIAIVVLFIPSYMIIASWNSLPGEGLYGTKIALERLTLAIASPSYAAETELQLRYTERRFAEAKSLFNDKHSVQGLSYLSDQVKSTRDTIVKAPNKKTRKELAALYVQKLTEVSAELETQKTVLTSLPSSKTVSVVPPKARMQSSQPAQVQQTTPMVPQVVQQSTTTKTSTTTSLKTTTSTVIKQQSSSPVSQPAPTQTVIAHVNTTTADIEPENMMAALQISQTQETIQQTINELQTVTQETTTTTTSNNENFNDDSDKKFGNDNQQNFQGDNGNRYGNNNGNNNGNSNGNNNGFGNDNRGNDRN